MQGELDSQSFNLIWTLSLIFFSFQILLYFQKKFRIKITSGLAVKAPTSRANDQRFEPCCEPTTLGESCESSTMSNDRLERTIAGSRAPMVLNYSLCVALGSGPA